MSDYYNNNPASNNPMETLFQLGALGVAGVATFFAAKKVKDEVIDIKRRFILDHLKD